MIRIYCIEDINDMKYIGSTSQTLNKRLSGHRNDKTRGLHCSSSKLDLEHSVIYEIERCHEDERMERERYWINKIDCVNERKLTYYRKEHRKEYYQQNKERKKKYQRDYDKRNKDKINEKKREYRQRCKISEFLKMLEEY